MSGNSGPDARGKRRTEPTGWDKLRARIYARDQGICRCCGAYCTRKAYRCGHLVDRIAGGTDEDDNLAVMCWLCDHIKPIHTTKEEFEAWIEAGGPHDPVERDRVFGQWVRQLIEKWKGE